jgi:peptidoglycan/xylan/chitin deacetylase (PgdA/CDA1 family)
VRLRSLIKETIYGAAAASGVVRVAGAHRGHGLIVLTYHSVGPAQDYPYLHRMPPDRFRTQMRYLKAHYDLVAIDAGLDALADTDPVMQRRRPMVAITVDDGYSDNYEHLFPIAQEERVPIAIFLATDYLDGHRLPWPTRASALVHFATATRCPIPNGAGSASSLPINTTAQKHAANKALRQSLSQLDQAERDAALDELVRELAPAGMRILPPLTWTQVREMQDAGVVFGSHTRYHAWLDRVSPEEIDRELRASKERIEAETARTCDLIAYPNGNFDARVRAATANAAYRFALTQHRGINTAHFDPLAVRRVEVPYNELLGTFKCRVAGFVR